MSEDGRKTLKDYQEEQAELQTLGFQQVILGGEFSFLTAPKTFACLKCACVVISLTQHREVCEWTT